MTFLEKIAQVKGQINDKNTPERNRELFHQLVVLNAYASYKGMESSEYDKKAQEKCEEYGRKYVDALGTYNDLTKQILDPVKVAKNKKLYAVDNKPMKLSTMLETSILTVRSFANFQKKLLEYEDLEVQAKMAKEALEFNTGINKIRRACEKLYAEPDFYQFWHRDTDEIIKLRSATEKAWDVANGMPERKDSPEVRKNILEAYKTAVNYMSLKMIGADKDPFDNEQMESFKPGSGMGEKRWEGAKEIVEAIRTLYPEETAKLDADRLEINYKASVDKIADSMSDESLTNLQAVGDFRNPDKYLLKNDALADKERFENSLARILTVETLRDKYKEAARTIGKGRMTREQFDSEIASNMSTIKKSPAFKEMLKSNSIADIKQAAEHGVGIIKDKFFKASNQIKNEKMNNSFKNIQAEFKKTDIIDDDSIIHTNSLKSLGSL